MIEEDGGFEWRGLQLGLVCERKEIVKLGFLIFSGVGWEGILG